MYAGGATQVDTAGLTVEQAANRLIDAVAPVVTTGALRAASAR